MSADTTPPVEPRPARLTFGIELEFLIPYMKGNGPDPHADVEGLSPLFRLTQRDLEDIETGWRYPELIIHARVRELLESHGLDLEIRSYKYDSDFEKGILRRYSCWSVVGDYSVQENLLDHPRDWTHAYSWIGVEVISPVEPDTPGAFKIIDYVRQLLTSTYRCRVNASTGLHVHVGQAAERFSLQSMKRIASLAWSAEKLLVTLNHPSRRAHYYTRTLRNMSRLSWRKPGSGPDHQEVNKLAGKPGATFADRPLDEPRLCLHYIATDLRYGEQPISWRENPENNTTKHIEAFQETRKEGRFDPFQYKPGSEETFDERMERIFGKGSTNKALVRKPTLEEEIKARAEAVSKLGVKTETWKGSFRKRTIPRIKYPHFTAKELGHYSDKLLHYGGGGLDVYNLPADPGVWEGVRQIFKRPSSCDIEDLLNPGDRGYISFRAYSCHHTITKGYYDRTIEVRGAEGTLGDWIVPWAKICIGLIRFAIHARADEFMQVLDNCDKGEKTDGYFDAIDLLDAIGLPEEAAAAEKRIERNKEGWGLEYVEEKE
ncbi:hypothetical protein F5Y13DRAFT_96848 [Hypoxylon sp. FL1857]|nr:hypothetical protein F5Y13DRAFT_96848 [Hypoxylon sp. FL1857]